MSNCLPLKFLFIFLQHIVPSFIQRLAYMQHVYSYVWLLEVTFVTVCVQTARCVLVAQPWLEVNIVAVNCYIRQLVLLDFFIMRSWIIIGWLFFSLCYIFIIILAANNIVKNIHLRVNLNFIVLPIFFYWTRNQST